MTVKDHPRSYHPHSLRLKTRLTSDSARPPISRWIYLASRFMSLFSCCCQFTFQAAAWRKLVASVTRLRFNRGGSQVTRLNCCTARQYSSSWTNKLWQNMCNDCSHGWNASSTLSLFNAAFSHQTLWRLQRFGVGCGKRWRWIDENVWRVSQQGEGYYGVMLRYAALKSAAQQSDGQTSTCFINGENCQVNVWRMAQQNSMRAGFTPHQLLFFQLLTTRITSVSC